MEVVLVIGFLLMVVAGVGKAVRDKLQFHYSTSIFSDPKKYNPRFWNPKISHLNKYKYDNKRYYVDEEKFFGSTTFLVFLTDAQHAAESLYINGAPIGAFLIGITILSFSWYIPALVIIAGLISMKVVFEIVFKWILSK